MRILIAEDDPASRQFLCKFLSQYGECDQVVDGLEAIDAYVMAMKDNDPYDLICLDIMMPKVDGVKVLKAIRDLERQNNIPPSESVVIIMITALGMTDHVHEAFALGCNAYAAKPIDTEKFAKMLKKLNIFPSSALENAAAEEAAP
ncbi:MAG: response regulator [Firmicutes bacterium]|nr:response regulator [Bacillota bacterium]